MARRWVRGLAWGAGAVAAIVAVAAIALVTLDWSRFAAPVGERIGRLLGREVTISGLDVEWGRVVRVRASGVRVANAPWGRAPRMAELGRVGVAVDVVELLLRWRLVLPEVSVTEPLVWLEKDQEGRSNWDFSRDPQARTAIDVAKPERRAEFPIIERLEITDGRLSYRDAGRGIALVSRLHTATGGDPAHRRVVLSGKGSLAGQAFTVDLEGGSLLTLRDEDRPYPLRLEAAVGDTRGHLDGTLTDPLHLRGVDLDVGLEGQDLAEVFPVLGIPAPRTEPYRITGRLRRQDGRWAMEGLSGRVGGSDLSGDLSVETAGPRPFLRARLASGRLRLADLGGFLGPRAPEGRRVLPDQPMELERLRAMDMEVEFTADRIESERIPLRRLDAALGLDNGLLVLDPLAFTLEAGEFSGRVVVDARQDLPKIETDLAVNKVDLAQFFEGTRFADEMKGTFAGRIRLNGRGRSAAEALGGADGTVSLFIGRGSVSNLLLELAGLDVAEALGFALTRDQPAAMRCMVADFAVAKGLAAARTLVLDTTDTLVTGEGEVDFGAETLALRLEAHPKDPSPLAARAPVELRGPWRKPEVAVDAAAQVGRAGAAAALGALLTPLAALLPFLEPGLGEDSPCAQMIQQAQTPG